VKPTWGEEIRTVRELLRAIAAGGILVHSQRWDLNEQNQWHEYRVNGRDGTQRAVRPSIAIAALRKGLVEVLVQ
jgi:hypothetical protein